MNTFKMLTTIHFGENALDHLKEIPYQRIMVIMDPFVYTSGLYKQITEPLEAAHKDYTIFSDVVPDAPLDKISAGVKAFLEYKPDAIVAVGGGSAIDSSKSIREFALKINPYGKVGLIAIPTTAGTGSEVTVTAVITDSEKKHKYTMNNFTFIPPYAVLDPEVTFTLPPSVTATTGMDALTNAVEAYIGNSTSRETRALALETVKLVFENIEAAYQDGTNRPARANMLYAAHKAGIAFSKSYVGYIHAVAHSLGGQYNIPHGLANSVLMPIVLEAYGEAAHKKLHELGIAAGVTDSGDSHQEGAEKFIQAIRGLNRRLNIPAALPGIRQEDIPQMACHAAKEANPLYPVPVLMDAGELEQFYYKVADWSQSYGSGSAFAKSA